MTDTRNGRYVRVRQPDHPRAGSRSGAVLEHILVAERVLGRFLPKSAQVHHVDENDKNNDPSNLVICEDGSYHQLLHRRMRAMVATGNPDALPCNVCGQFDVPERLRVFQHKWKGRSYPNVRAYHRACKTEEAARYRRRRASTKAASHQTHNSSEIAVS